MDYLKKLKATIEKGFATQEEKDALAKEFENLDSETKEVAQEKLEEVKNLPAEQDEQKELQQNIQKLVEQETDKKTEEKSKEIMSEVQRFLDEQKEQMQKKTGMFADGNDTDKVERRKALNNSLREGLKYLVGSSYDTEKVKEMTTDETSPFAGYITDDQLSAEIRHLQTEYGVAAREMNTVEFQQTSYKANNLATDVSTFWVDEASKIKSTQATLGQKTLELKKLAAIVTVTRELLQEQEIDFISFLGSRVAEGFAQQEDDAFFNGDGTSSYGGFTGLLQDGDVPSTTLNSGTTFSDLTADDLIEMVDATRQGALGNGKFYMNRTVRSVVRKLQDSNGMYIYQEPARSEPATIWGYPVVEVEVMPDTGQNNQDDTAFVLFGDMQKATIRGIRGGIQADRFTSGTVRNVADNDDINLITSDREAVRWVTQVGFIPIIPDAMTKLKTNSSSA